MYGHVGIIPSGPQIILGKMFVVGKQQAVNFLTLKRPEWLGITSEIEFIIAKVH